LPSLLWDRDPGHLLQLGGETRCQGLIGGFKLLETGLGVVFYRDEVAAQGFWQAADQLGDLLFQKSRYQPVESSGSKLIEYYHGHGYSDSIGLMARFEAVGQGQGHAHYIQCVGVAIRGLSVCLQELCAIHVQQLRILTFYLRAPALEGLGADHAFWQTLVIKIKQIPLIDEDIQTPHPVLQVLDLFQYFPIMLEKGCPCLVVALY
jgi:hypothetical protein